MELFSDLDSVFQLVDLVVVIHNGTVTIGFEVNSYNNITLVNILHIFSLPISKFSAALWRYLTPVGSIMSLTFKVSV